MPPPPQQQQTSMPHYQPRSPMVVTSQPFAPSITPVTHHTPALPQSLPPQSAPSPRPISQPVQQSIHTPIAPPSPALTPKQELDHAAIEQTNTPSSQSLSRRQSNSVSIAPFDRMPTYPQLPWYSVPEADFPTRARQRRRRKQIKQEVPTIFPDRSEALDEDFQGQTTDEAPSEVSTIAAPSDPETPATSRAPSERDCSQPADPVNSAPAISASPKVPAAQLQHGRRDTRTAIAVPNIPALSRPKPSPPVAVVNEALPTAVQATTPNPDEQESSAVKEEQSTEQEEAPAPAPAPPAPKSWAELVKRNAPKPTAARPQFGAVTTNGVSLPKSASLADALRQYSVQEDTMLSYLEPRGLVNTGNMCYMNSVRSIITGQLIACR